MLGFFLVLGACALWAVDTLIRYPLLGEGIGAFEIVFYEHLILTAIFSIVFFKSLPKISSLRKTHLLYFVVIGAIGSALSTLAFTKAFTILNPSLVILLQKFQPVVAIGLAHIVLGEKVQKLFVLWATVCLVGAFLISYEDISRLDFQNKTIQEIFFQKGALQGYFLVLFSVVGWGASTVFGKKLIKIGYQDEQVMGGRFILGFLSLLPFLFTDHHVFQHSVEIYGKVSLMVLVSGLLAMYLYYHGLRKISARSCSLTEMFFPFMAVVVNWLFLDATLSIVQISGGILLLIGSLIIQLKQY